MGLIQHYAIVATTWNEESADALDQWISSLQKADKELFTPRMGSWVNGYITYVLVPDGSKEGWALSRIGDSLRDRFIARLGKNWEWVEVSFGDLGYNIPRGG